MAYHDSDTAVSKSFCSCFEQLIWATEIMEEANDGIPAQSHNPLLYHIRAVCASDHLLRLEMAAAGVVVVVDGLFTCEH